MFKHRFTTMLPRRPRGSDLVLCPGSVPSGHLPLGMTCLEKGTLTAFPPMKEFYLYLTLKKSESPSCLRC